MKTKVELTEVKGNDGFYRLAYLDKGQRDYMKEHGLNVEVLRGQKLEKAKKVFFGSSEEGIEHRKYAYKYLKKR